MHSETTSAAPIAPGGPTPIPAPPDFPVRWPSPGDAMLLWEREAMHMPFPTTAMDAEMQERALAGAGVAFAAYDMPVRLRIMRLNTWVYQAVAPVSFDHAELEALGRSAEAKLGEAIATLRERWEGEWLPEIQQAIEWWEQFDLAAASDPALADHLAQSLSRFDRLWTIHFQIVIPMLMGVSLFDDFFREAVGGDTFEPYRLLQGLENKSIEADLALWRLGRHAAAQPAVRRAFDGVASADVLAQLDASDAGRAFRADFDAFLDVYGRRADAFTYVSLPSWREDPAMPISTLRDFIAQSDRDLEQEHANLGAERERLVGATRERLADAPEQVREQFEFLLRAGETGSILQEDHNFWLDCRSIGAMREILLECGRRLAGRGVLGAVDDAFQLTSTEIVASLAGDTDGLADAVAARRDELARFGGVVPPPVLGALPPGPPPDDPVTRTILKMFGAPPATADSASELCGLAGSPGTVRGRARVLRSLADSSRLGRGEILVTAVTSPPWTPLFAIAAGIVTDTGGILSHCAVVAREYMIPAVVGTKAATSVIQDGQLIEVDGDAGVVRMLGAS